jgi:hypothetical protein
VEWQVQEEWIFAGPGRPPVNKSLHMACDRAAVRFRVLEQKSARASPGSVKSSPARKQSAETNVDSHEAPQGEQRAQGQRGQQAGFLD